MLRGRTLLSPALALAAALSWASPAAADIAIGGGCPSSTAQSAQATLGGNNVVCIGSLWQYPAYQFGSTSASCNSTNAGIIQWTGSNLQLCNASSWVSINSTYDLGMFYPGTIGAGAFARVVSARAATYPTNLAGSYCVAKEGATSSTTVNINQIHAGSSSNVGTVVFGSGGGTNVTNCTFSAASGISLAAGDALEFAFPASPDATLGDVAIALQGTHQ